MPKPKVTRRPPPLTTFPTVPPEERGVSFDQLPLKARLRFEHAEKWVAWAPDENSVIASGEDYEEVREAARRAGFPHAICEWVTPVPIRPLWR